MTDAEKAAILDWLLRPQGDRPDRPLKIERSGGNFHKTLWAFRVWCKPEEFIKNIQEQMYAR